MGGRLLQLSYKDSWLKTAKLSPQFQSFGGGQSPAALRSQQGTVSSLLASAVARDHNDCQIQSRSAWHGILVPVPLRLLDEAVLLADPEKTWMFPSKHGSPLVWSSAVMIPSTPAGVWRLFHEYGIDLEVKRCHRSFKYRWKTDEAPTSL